MDKFSKLKALVDLVGKIPSYFVFHYSENKNTTTWNWEFLLPSMIPRVIEEFPVIFFVYRTKNDKTGLRIHLKAASHSAIFFALVCEIKNTGAVLPTKDVASARHGSYSFEFCSLYAAQAWNSLSEKCPDRELRVFRELRVIAMAEHSNMESSYMLYCYILYIFILWS